MALRTCGQWLLEHEDNGDYKDHGVDWLLFIALEAFKKEMTVPVQTTITSRHTV